MLLYQWAAGHSRDNVLDLYVHRCLPVKIDLTQILESINIYQTSRQWLSNLKQINSKKCSLMSLLFYWFECENTEPSCIIIQTLVSKKKTFAKKCTPHIININSFFYYIYNWIVIHAPKLEIRGKTKLDFTITTRTMSQMNPRISSVFL